MVYIWLKNSDCFLHILNILSWLKYVLNWEPQTLFGWYGNCFCHLGFNVCWCEVITLAPCYIISTSCCLRILGISHLDYYFLCQLLAGCLKLQDFWSNDLPPLNEGFLTSLLLWVLWQRARTRNVCTTFSHNSNVYGWLRTARNWGLAIVFAS